MDRAKTKQASDEIRARRWKWLGHLLRQDHGNDCNIALTWAPEGKQKMPQNNMAVNG